VSYSGASDSGGQTSWTGKPELCDYISAYGFILKYLQLLAPSKPVELVLGGYSYGSMMVYHQPKVEDIVSLFASPKSGSLASELLAKARELLQGENKDQNNNQEDTESELPLATVSYLILSPVLSLASGLITLWSNLSRVSIQGKQLTTPPPEEQLPKHRTLVVYGTDDMFTSVKSFQQWTAQLSNSPDSQVRSVEIPFAGHFWLEQNYHAQLRKTISTWLDDAQ
jgi:alpha/beta superfamily hydrolase